MMELDGPQQKQVREALKSAYPTRQDLERMVFDGLGEHLSFLASDDNLEHTVFELLRWAQARGRLEELIVTASKQNSGNPQLMSVAALLGVSSGQSSSDVPLSTGPRYWNIPHLHNPFFTGQEELLDELAEALSKKRRASLSQGITGLGGIGKTQIAVEYAHRYQQEYQAVLWVFAETRESLISGYMAIARLVESAQDG